jgi:hypothetical protein
MEIVEIPHTTELAEITEMVLRGIPVMLVYHQITITVIIQKVIMITTTIVQKTMRRQ